MELELLKERWAEYDRRLDVSIRLNEQLLRAASLNRVRSPLRRFAVLVGLGAVTGLWATVVLGQFIYARWMEPRFALPAAVLDAWMVANIAASIRLMVGALEVDYSQPIATIQKQLGNLRVLRLQVTKWGLLTGQLVWWIPFLIVTLKGLWDVDAYQVFSAWFLIVNVAFGLAMIPIAIWVSRRFGERMGRSPRMQQLMRELAGYNLTAATGFLATLSEFESESGHS